MRNTYPIIDEICMFVSHNEWENYLLRLDRAPFLLCIKPNHVQDELSTNCIQGGIQ